jgi:hypothetical protein
LASIIPQTLGAGSSNVALFAKVFLLETRPPRQVTARERETENESERRFRIHEYKEALGTHPVDRLP